MASNVFHNPNASAFSSMQQISIMETVIEEGPGNMNSVSSNASGNPNLLEYMSSTRLHLESTPILFRHFADIIVRLAFLRARNPDTMHTELEDIVENHLKVWSTSSTKIKTATTKHPHEDELHVLAYFISSSLI